MNMEEEATEIVVALYDEAALEMADMDTFLEGLQARFRDSTQVC